MISHRSAVSKKNRVGYRRGSISEVPRVQIFLDVNLNKALNDIKNQRKKQAINSGNKKSQFQNNQTKYNLQTSNSIQESITMIPNDLVMKYIKQVYNKYKIKDPLEEEGDYSCDIHNLKEYNSINIINSLGDSQMNKFQSKRNSTVTTKYPYSQYKNYQTQKKDKRMSITRSKIQNLKNKYKNQILLHQQDENTIKKINYGNDFSQEPHYTEQETLDFQNTSLYTAHGRSKILSSHQNIISSFDQGQTMNFKPKKKLLIKTKARAISTNPSCQVGSLHKRTPQINISTQNLQQIHFNQNYNISQGIDLTKKNEEVIPIYRYCLMCEQCILEHNINFHEKKCKTLEKAYTMSLSELLSLVQQKINRLKKQIIESPLYNLNQDKINTTKKVVFKWLQNMESNIQKNLFSEYEKVEYQIKNNYLQSCELINKLNWFLKLKKNFIQRQA